MRRDAARFKHPSGDGFYSDLEVCQSCAGFYLGRMHWNRDLGGFMEPGSRESDYFATREEAAAALASMEFDLRDADENESMYRRGVPRPEAKGAMNPKDGGPRERKG